MADTTALELLLRLEGHPRVSLRKNTESGHFWLQVGAVQQSVDSLEAVDFIVDRLVADRDSLHAQGVLA